MPATFHFAYFCQQVFVTTPIGCVKKKDETIDFAADGLSGTCLCPGKKRYQMVERNVYTMGLQQGVVHQKRHPFQNEQWQ